MPTNRTYSTRLSQPRKYSPQSHRFRCNVYQKLFPPPSTAAALDVRAARPRDQFAALTRLVAPSRVEVRLNKIYWTLVQQVPSRAILRHAN